MHCLEIDANSLDDKNPAKGDRKKSISPQINTNNLKSRIHIFETKASPTLVFTRRQRKQVINHQMLHF